MFMLTKFFPSKYIQIRNPRTWHRVRLAKEPFPILYHVFGSSEKDTKPAADASTSSRKVDVISPEVPEKVQLELTHFKVQRQSVRMETSERDLRYTIEDFPDPEKLIPKEEPPIGEITLPHPVWTKGQLESVRVAHKKPNGFVDWLAYISVQTVRSAFDLTSGYAFGSLNANNWLRRIIFLETVAGVPGMMGAMVRHLKSLRTMKRDHGWIHTLLEEAENERMHLMVAMQIYNPGRLFRFGVVVTQGIFVNLFFIAYLISPRFCHRFVGYLEEEAVKTYTKLLQDIKDGKIVEWTNRPAVDSAVRYWRLPFGSTFYDMFEAIRADEAHHRFVNHTLSSMQESQYNPFKPGS